jgi:hypothetical protein
MFGKPQSRKNKPTRSMLDTNETIVKPPPKPFTVRSDNQPAEVVEDEGEEKESSPVQEIYNSLTPEEKQEMMALCQAELASKEEIDLGEDMDEEEHDELA